MTPPHAPRMPVRTSAQLQELWRELMGPRGFTGRTLWLVFLDHDDRPHELVVPIGDLPLAPDPELLTSLRGVVDTLLADGTVSAVPMLLARPGDPAMTAADRRWARALRRHLDAHLGGWPVHLATRGRVQPFGPDDLRAVG